MERDPFAGYNLPSNGDYYDLIELPNKKHIPVPIAKRLVGERILEAIPVSHKVRDNRYFYCIDCDEYQTRLIQDGIVNIEPTSTGYSFTKCKQHNPKNEEEDRMKVDMLIRLILNGMYKNLRYVRADGSGRIQ